MPILVPYQTRFPDSQIKIKCLAFHSKFLQRLFYDKYCIIRSLPFTQQDYVIYLSTVVTMEIL